MPKVVDAWIRTEVERLLRQGLSVREVAALIEAKGASVSPTYVSSVARKIGVQRPVGAHSGAKRPRPKDEAKRQRARELRDKGLSLSAIGAEMGITRQGVHFLLSDDD